VHERALSNGLPVWVVEMHEVPVVQIALVVEAGSAEDPSGHFGLASLTASMLDEGAGTRSALDIADAIDFLGAQLSTGSSYDASAVRLGVPVARLPDALPIFADVVLRPAFPEDEVTRLKRERLTALMQARDNPAAVASEGFLRVLFGREHRYGTGEVGTAPALEGFVAQNLKAFYAAYYRPDNATLVVVGDVETDAVVSALEEAFGSWRAAGTAVRRAPLATVRQAATRRVYIIDKPGAPQTQIRIGAVGVPRSTPDYFALAVMNTILGDSYTSRLNNNLRETHGYSYGAASGFAMRRFAGPFSAEAGVQTEKTAEALREFFNELNGILEPVPAAELEKAKNLLALGMPGRFETTSDLIGRLQELIVYDLPRDYFSNYVANLQAVTAGDVQRVAREHIRPDRVAVVAVGDRKTIESGIRALDLGPVTVLSVEDILGPAPRVAFRNGKP
jgi:predicted Zn-dependent peptidase